MIPPQAPDCPFELCSFSHGNFYSALSNKFLSAAEIGTKHRAIYLAKYLTRLRARLIIVEHDYTDAGYLDDYAAYYVKCFQSYDRRCKRLHFFSEEIATDVFMRIIEGKATQAECKRFAASYIGFIVARPLPDAIIGRTVVKTYDPDNGRRHYTCVREYHANLFGFDLTVESLAFQEQDTVMAACATVALWCAFHKTRDLFNSPAPTPAEITRAANRLVFNSRSIPSHGLNVQQITHAIQSVSLEPEVIPVTQDTPLVSLVYAHLKWGLPVILGVDMEGVGRHAITLVGYSLVKERVREREVEQHNGVEVCAPMVGLRIDRLFAHDDRIGPFVRLNIERNLTPDEKHPMPVILKPKWPTDKKESQASNDLGETDKGTGMKLPPVIYPRTVIVPVYHKIRVTFQDVEKFLLKFTEVLQLIHSPQKSIEWDLHLTSTNEYKDLIKRPSNISRETKMRILLSAQPKYFWRAILRIENQNVMELLADATDMSRSFPIFFAVWYNQEDKSTLHNYLETDKFKDATVKALGVPFWSFLKEWS
jgi:hypothetical protein